MTTIVCVQPKCCTLFVSSQNVALYLCPAKMLHFICVQPKCYTLFVSSQKVKHDLNPVTPVRLHPELMHMVLKDFMSTGKI